MMQKETLQFFGAYRRFGRANKNMNKQSLIVCGVDMEELKQDGLERPGMAELLVYSMLVAHRHATTNVCWLSKRGCADKLCLSPSTVHEAYKWLEKARLIYLHEDNRLVRKMVKNGKGHLVNLYTIFDLPGYRWASTVRVTTSKHLAAKFEREPQDANEGFYETLNDVLEDEEARLEAKIHEVESEPDYPLKEEHVGLVSEEMLAEAEKEEAEQEAARELRAWQEEQGQLQLLLGGNDGK